MPEKPSVLPEWSTDGGTTLEPSAGEKAAGFATDTRPPARWMNWILNLLYGWIQYLNAPVGTGAGAGLAATGGATDGTGLAGTGGATNGVGVNGQGTGTGTGVVGTGGETGVGVRGFGGATSGGGVVGVASGASFGVSGTGGPTDGRGGSFSGQGAGEGVRGTGGATGIGVYGVGSGGYGVKAESDTTSPISAALHVVPQNADPTSPAAGDFYVHVTTGKVRGYNGTTWDRYIPQSYAIPSASTAVHSTSAETPFDRSYSIPANTLRVGSTIRIRAVAVVGSVNSGTITLRLRIGGVGGTSITTTGAVTLAAGSGVLTADLVVLSTGATGSIVGGGIGIFDNDAYNAAGFAATTIDTTAAQSIVATTHFSVAHAGNSIALQCLIVDVT